MKQFFLLLLLAISPGLSFLYASAGGDSLVGDADFYLEMKGRVLESHGQNDDEKKGLDSASYSVLNEKGIIVLSGAADSKGRLSFKLPLGRKFTMNFTKKGYVQKIIIVDTHVPADARKVYSFAFDVDIFEQVNGLDVSVLNKPVARVAYKPIDKNFSYDVAYTNKVNAALQKMYRDYYALKRKEDKAQSDSVPADKKYSGRQKKSEPYGKDSKPK